MTGVLDWPGFSIGDPVMDVGSTIFVCRVGASHILQVENADAAISSYIETYLQAYRKVRPLNSEHIEYYRAMRAVTALLEGAEGQEVWKSPEVVRFLTETAYDVTGVRVSPPSDN